LTSVAGIFLSTLAVAVPFYFAGMIVSIALTRVPGSIGYTYAVDMIGASLGSVLVIPLLRFVNLPSAVFATGLIASVSAYSFARFAGSERRWRLLALAVALGLIAGANSLTYYGFRLGNLCTGRPNEVQGGPIDG
jgi:hypothetical protein